MVTADPQTPRGDDKTIRCFLAAPVNQELAEALSTSVNASLDDLPPLRVTPTANLHVTLVFLGNMTERVIDETIAPRVADVIREAHPGRIFFRQVVGFPSTDSPRHLALEGHASPSAESLQRSLKDALTPVMAAKPASDPRWRPHITLGRFKNATNASVTATPWQTELPVAEIGLYESLTTLHGPVYRIRHQWPLGQAGD